MLKIKTDLLLGNDSVLFRSRDAPAPVYVFFSDSAPGTAVALEQFFGFDRSPGACGVIRKPSSRQCMPHVENRLDDAPPGFHHIRALKQRSVSRHAIAQQSLVARAVLHAEV